MKAILANRILLVVLICALFTQFSAQILHFEALGTTNTFGRTDNPAGDQAIIANRFAGTEFTMTEAGFALSISACISVDGAAHSAKCAIYNATDNAFVASTDTLTKVYVAFLQWNNFTFSTQQYLPAQNYILVIAMDTSFSLGITWSGTYKVLKDDHQYANLWPTTFEDAILNAEAVTSIYCTYTVEEEVNVLSTSSNSTYISTTCNFSINWQAKTGKTMDGWIFGSNNTGVFTNETWASMTEANAVNTSIIKTLNSTVGNVVQWCGYANNSENLWGSTGLINITLSAPPAPSYFWNSVWVNSTKPNSVSMFSCRFNSTVALSFGVFEHNNTGILTNTTVALSGTDAWFNQSITLNATYAVLQWRMCANNSYNAWITTMIFYVHNHTVEANEYTVGKTIYDANGQEFIPKGYYVLWGSNTPTQNFQLPNDTDNAFSGYTIWSKEACDHNFAIMKFAKANMFSCQFTLENWILDNNKTASALEQYAEVNATGRNIINEMVSWAYAYNLSVSMRGYMPTYAEERVSLPYPPTHDGSLITSKADFINQYVQFAYNMSAHPNIWFHLYDEPNCGSTALLTDWFTVTANVTMQMRGAGIHNIMSINTDQFNDVMDTWVANSTYWNMTKNMVFSPHIYRYHGTFGNDPDTYVQSVYWIAQDGVHTYDEVRKIFYNNTIVLSSAVRMTHIRDDLGIACMVSAIGAYQYLDKGEGTQAQQDNENECLNNSLTVMDELGIGYCVYQWQIYAWWSGFRTCKSSPEQPVRLPNVAGIYAMAHASSYPYVYNAGNDTATGYGDYLYSNNTSWSSSWNSGAKQLTVSITGSGTTKLRVFWNVSNSFPMNSTLKVNFGNGTVVDFEDYFNSATSLGIFPLSLSTLTITFGYNMDGSPSVGSPTASTTVEASTCTISCTLTDDVGLSYGILSTNATGPWMNNTGFLLSGLSYSFSDSVALPSAGTVFGYKILVNDSADQWTTSSTYTFITTSQGSTPPQGPPSGGFSRFLCMFTVSSNGRALQDLKIRLWENNYSVLIETLQTDSEGYVETELPSGTYEYSADFGGQTKRGYVLLDDAKKITIDFDSAQKSTFDRSSLIKVSFALVVVACAIVAVLAVKNRH